MKIGSVLREKREKRSKTQINVAVATGMTQRNISSIENDKVDSKLGTVEKICRYLRVKMWQVVKEAEDR